VASPENATLIDMLRTSLQQADLGTIERWRSRLDVRGAVA